MEELPHAQVERMRLASLMTEVDGWLEVFRVTAPADVDRGDETRARKAYEAVRRQLYTSASNAQQASEFLTRLGLLKARLDAIEDRV